MDEESFVSLLSHGFYYPIIFMYSMVLSTIRTCILGCHSHDKGKWVANLQMTCLVACAHWQLLISSLRGVHVPVVPDVHGGDM